MEHMSAVTKGVSTMITKNKMIVIYKPREKTYKMEKNWFDRFVEQLKPTKLVKVTVKF